MATPEEHEEANASVVVAIVLAAIVIVALLLSLAFREPVPTQVLPDQREQSLLVAPEAGE